MLQGTLSSDAGIRRDAERALTVAESQGGYLVALFGVITADTSHPMVAGNPAVQQSGAIYLKNLIRRRWSMGVPLKHAQKLGDSEGVSSGGGTQGIPENEKAMVRAHLMEALVRCEPRVTLQLAEAMKIVAISDFPSRWPGLVEEIMKNLLSLDSQREYAALLALRNIVKVFEFKKPDTSAGGEDPRKPLNDLVETTFPHLLQILHRIQGEIIAGTGDLSFAHIKQRFICKIFWSSTQYTLPPHLLHNPDKFQNWVGILVHILTTTVPFVEVHESNDELLRLPPWKTKKWIGHIFHRIFQRYGDPKHIPDGENPLMTRFSRTFLNEYAPVITSAMLQILSWHQLSPRITNVAINYLEASISTAITWQVLVPHIESFLTKVLFPILCINNEDLKLWSEDPIEYVRKSYDILEDFYSPRAAAGSMIYSLSKLRAKKTVIPFLHFCVQVLDRYLDVPMDSPEKEIMAKQKDGALAVIGQVKDRLQSKSDLRVQLKQMIRVHVLPEFDSNFPFLRARACWILGQFALQPEVFQAIQFEGPDDSEVFDDPAILGPAFEKVIRSLTDPEFPVRVRAAVDIRHFMTNPQALEAIKPILNVVLEQLFSLVDEVDNTDIVTTIEEIVDRFSGDILPYAVPLARRLTQLFLRSAAAGEDEDEASLAAVQCLHTLVSILQALTKHDPENSDTMCKGIEEIVNPILKDMFLDERMEFFDESLDLLSTLVYYQDEPLSPFLWSLFEAMYHAFMEWTEYIGCMVAPLHNFMHKGNSEFLIRQSSTGISYKEMVFNMISRLLQDGVEENETKEIAKVAEVFILYCRGHIDEYIPRIVELSISRLLHSANPVLRVLLITTITHLIFYNPVLSLGALHAMQMIQEFFTLWLAHLESFKRIHDKKATCLAICAIFSLRAEEQPDTVRQAYSHLVRALVVLLQRIQEQRNEHAKEGERPVFEGCRIPSTGESDVGDDEDVEDDLDNDLRHLIGSSAGATSLVNREDEMLEMEDEGEFETPMDDLDELLYAADVIANAASNSLQMVIPGLEDMDKQALQSILQEASRRRSSGM
eukprot:CAMPEP_0184690216 /NCGR_PEP_ID=MMETSP0312-20130426/31095_1 /TAXON_ID=31354 /ORGANISM="Compsopogon coeruleus, Strain SAG 36.94" /LENGTH=1052 /DNA_ID=CAMNT_0027147671 /DNA_START=124 /DNA_END=3282 /DNA_ORIENTATION=+